MFDLNTPIEKLYLVGPARAKLLQNLGITTLKDLLFYFPRTHSDLSKLTPISEIKPSENVNIKAQILSVSNFRTRVRRLNLTQALVQDDSGSIVCMWFNQPFLAKVLKKNEQFIFSGKAVMVKNKLQLQNPIYEQEKAEQIHTSRLVPIYPLTAHLTQKQLRSIIKIYLDKTPIHEYLPLKILQAEKLLDEDTAVKTFHFPIDRKRLIQAQNRLAFDEIFETQLRVLQFKKFRQLKSSYEIRPDFNLPEKIKELPFTLTESQQKSLNEIINDFTKSFPANRLLQGDVGSGKTIIAALTMWLVAKNGLQAALLSPTEVLAQQHYSSLLKFFQKDNISIGLLTSSTSRINGEVVSKSELLNQIQNNKIPIVLGTHALLEKNVEFKKLALVVIDEQHRFGVKQRSMLKQMNNTHLLTMSATPIPRTLALTLYGDLDISLLTELPSGRKKIITKTVAEDDRKSTYEFIRREIKNGRQVFVVCPLVEESDKLGVKAAEAEYKKIKDEIFPEFRTGLLHGRMKPVEKESVMQTFKDNETQILVSTSVIEVGVDVPNATVMIIEGAERFGLAQLHQFRGRVGRSELQSYCFLFSDDPQASKNPRLQALVESNNGFILAEKDLMIRGSGDLYGTQQSGYEFKIATLSNLKLVERSKDWAQKLLDEDLTLIGYPLLREKIKDKPIIHLE
jgi:ATP-dependent DNA helicase RecG